MGRRNMRTRPETVARINEGSRALTHTRPSPPQPLRVLALEDDADMRDTLALVLSAEEGFDAEIVGDVATCLDRLRISAAHAAAAPFAVLLLDLILRDGHLGTEVLRAAATPDGHPMRLPPVVICTGHSSAYLAHCAPEVAAAHAWVLGKPFDIDELTNALRAAARGQ